MKKIKNELIIIYAVLVTIFITSCEREMVKPIETYGGLKYIVTRKDLTLKKNYNLQLKNKDTIFWITVLYFDGKYINIGDSIK